MQQISLDEEFLFSVLKKASQFFIYGILPELIGKWYTRLQEYVVAGSIQEFAVSAEISETNQSVATWDFCQTGESGGMIACDNEKCKII